MPKHLTDQEILKAAYNAKKKYYFEFLSKIKKDELPDLGVVRLHSDDFDDIERELGISKTHFIARLNCINEKFSSGGIKLATISNNGGFDVQLDFPLLDGLIAKMESDKKEHIYSRALSLVGIVIAVFALFK